MTASKLLVKLSQRLFEDASQQAEFRAALTHPQPFAPCIVWTKQKPCAAPFATEPPVPWQPEFVDRLALDSRPGQHPMHQDGYYYCLDFSSVFAVSPVFTLPRAGVVVDVCASPGGKSIVTWRSHSPALLLSNDVIGKRMGALISNLNRCQIQPAIATHVDPQVLAAQIPQTADLVLVDAPCTGQSLLAKGHKAPGCFHPVTINKNANRQKRIIANAAQVVAPQGYLVYMTCAYSPEENEQVVDWLLERFPHFQPIPIPPLQPHQSPLSDRPYYRMFPQAGLGAGAFTALLQNQTSGDRAPLPEEFIHHPRTLHFPAVDSGTISCGLSRGR